MIYWTYSYRYTYTTWYVRRPVTYVTWTSCC